MNPFQTLMVDAAPRVKAPDGSDVRVLLQLAGGSMAHFELPPGATSMGVLHRTVEELWYILEGSGEMWRRQGQAETIAPLAPGTCLSIPLGTCFQFRNTGRGAPLRAVAVTLPPWPGPDEAVAVEGPWPVTPARP